MPDTPLPRIHGIRGATTVERNEAAEILGATDELLRAIIETNELRPDDIVSAFSQIPRGDKAGKGSDKGVPEAAARTEAVTAALEKDADSAGSPIDAARLRALATTLHVRAGGSR